MIILTGGAGFIGSVLLAKLNGVGITDIVVVDNLNSSSKRQNLEGKSFLEYLHKGEFLARLTAGQFSADTIIHLGACTSTLEQNAEYMLQNNFQYSKTIAEWCLAHKTRVIYASSAATYGDGSLGFSDDISLLQQLRPLNIYAESKHLFDLWAVQTGAIDSMVGLKFFNVYGPNEYHKEAMRSVVVKAFEEIQATGKVSLFKSYHPDYPDGGQLRDFVYAEDVAETILWLLSNRKVSGLFNVGSGRARSWADLAAATFQALGRSPNISFIEMPTELRAIYQYKTEARMEKLGAAGCPVRYRSLEDGVRTYVQEYLNRSGRRM